METSKTDLVYLAYDWNKAIAGYKPKIITYSYSEGLKLALYILIGALLFSLISMMFSLFIKRKVKDGLTVFFTNMMVKPVLLLLLYILIEQYGISSNILIIVFIVLDILLEGLIYSFIFEKTKLKGFLDSILYNILPGLFAGFMIYVFLYVLPDIYLSIKYPLKVEKF